MTSRYRDDDPEGQERDPRNEVYGRREASGVWEEEPDFDGTGGDLSLSSSLGGHSRQRLLSFYDELRAKIVDWMARRGGRLSGPASKAILVVPDVFILLVRLTLDREVPRSARALIGGALAYFILPFDLLPEALVGPVGYMDDLVLAVAVLGQAFGNDLEPYAHRHWSGSEDLRSVLRDVSRSADHLLGDRLYSRLRRFLGRRGVRLGER